MGTTAVAAEVLIIGIQASVWLALLVLSLVGYDWVAASLAKLANWEVAVTLLGLAFAYTLGIFIDRLADWSLQLLSPAGERAVMRIAWIRRRASQGDPRIAVLSRCEEIPDFLAYVRGRLRVVRATVFNLALTTVMSCVFIAVRCGSLGCSRQWGLGIAASAIGSALTALADLPLIWWTGR